LYATVLVLVGVLTTVQCARPRLPSPFQHNYDFVNNTMCWNTDMYFVVDVVHDNGSIQVVKTFFNGIVDQLDIRSEFIRVGVVDGRNTRILLSAKDGTDRTTVKQFIKDLSPGTADAPDLSESLGIVYSSVDVHRNLVVVIVRDGSRTGAGSALLSKQETFQAYQKCWGYTAEVLGVAISPKNDPKLREMFTGHESDLYTVEVPQALDNALATLLARRICPGGTNSNLCVADVFLVVDSLADDSTVTTPAHTFLRTLVGKLNIGPMAINVGLYVSDVMHNNPDQGTSQTTVSQWIGQLTSTTQGMNLVRPLDAIYRYISNHENNPAKPSPQTNPRHQRNFVIFVRDQTAVSTATVSDAIKRVRGFNATVFTMAVGDKADQQTLNSIYDYHRPELYMLDDYKALTYQLGKDIAAKICRSDPDPSRQGGAVGLRSFGVVASLFVALIAFSLRQ
jgi:hypothetical protein